VNDKAARITLGLLVAAISTSALSLDLPSRAKGQFWNDEATYYSMTLSLVSDRDIVYDRSDLLRVKKDFPAGPVGLFLKQSSGGFTFDKTPPWIRRLAPGEKRIYFAKPFIYPVVAAPLAAVLGTRGLLLTNALFLGLALVLAFSEMRRQAGAGWALCTTLALFLLTVTPLYLCWLTPEVFCLGVVTAGLVAWRRERLILAGLLLGIATYAKPPNLLLALPLVVEPFFGHGPFWNRLTASVRRGVPLAATIGLLFGLNAVITGEWNPYGGDRKTFYGPFPYETPEAAFENSGFPMVVEHTGPLVEGEAADASGAPLARAEIRAAFVSNLAYFWLGRFSGALPYFFPAVVALLLFFFLGPRSQAGWLALMSLLVSYLVYIWRIPANWYGGGGTVGNRYFLNLLPLAVFLVPRGREAWVGLGGVLGALTFLGPILASPIGTSLHPGEHATHGIFLSFPAELSMLNDLAVFAESWRKRRPVGDTEGDPHKHWPPDPKAYWLYFLDDGTYGKESAFGVAGFWLRGGERAEVVVRAVHRVRGMHVLLFGGPAGDRVQVELEGSSETVVLSPGEGREALFEPSKGFPYYGTLLYELHFRSSYSGLAKDPRKLGAFVHITLDVDRLEFRR